MEANIAEVVLLNIVIIITIIIIIVLIILVTVNQMEANIAEVVLTFLLLLFLLLLLHCIHLVPFSLIIALPSGEVDHLGRHPEDHARGRLQRKGATQKRLY